MPYIIVFGNEKGGTGKSTLAMHVLTALLYEKKISHIVSADIDGRQGTLSRYLENRQSFIGEKQSSLPYPMHHYRFTPHDVESFHHTFEQIQNNNKIDILLIDTPGSHTSLSTFVHEKADLLVTPINDSFPDLDMLAHARAQQDDCTPGTYAEAVWENRKNRALQQQKSFEWLVVRNRLSGTRSHNRIQVEKRLHDLSKRFSFHLSSGMGERVIFRQLFPMGLTLLDLKHPDVSIPLNSSSVMARQELRKLIKTIKSFIH